MRAAHGGWEGTALNALERASPQPSKSELRASRPREERGEGEKSEGEPHSFGSAVTATFIVPCATTITRSVLESKAMEASRRPVICAATRTPSAFC